MNRWLREKAQAFSLAKSSTQAIEAQSIQSVYPSPGCSFLNSFSSSTKIGMRIQEEPIC
jgi:hypothetical protein